MYYFYLTAELIYIWLQISLILIEWTKNKDLRRNDLKDKDLSSSNFGSNKQSLKVITPILPKWKNWTENQLFSHKKIKVTGQTTTLKSGKTGEYRESKPRQSWTAAEAIRAVNL